MKNAIQITTVLLLLVHAIGLGQSTTETPVTNTVETSTIDKTDKAEKYIDDYKQFLGSYLLAEGDFTLDIVAEDNKLFIVTEFSKDILIPTNKTTLHEMTRGVDLQLIEGNPNALKFTQNGYETTIKRVKSKTEE